jgi:hypothetical protein
MLNIPTIIEEGRKGSIFHFGCDPNDDMPVYKSNELDVEEIDYLAGEFGVQFDDEGDIE